MAKKTIYLTESNYTKLREALIQKLATHPQHVQIGKSDKLGYEELAEFIQKSLTPMLDAPEYARLKTLEKQVSYHSLWTIIYHTKKKPRARKRMNRIAIELLFLFAFGEISPEMLEEEIQQPYLSKPSISELQEAVAVDGFAYYEEFSFRKLQQSIKKAKVEIKILDTFLDNWGKLRNHLKAATKRNCKVRLIVNDAHLQPIVDRSKSISSFGGSQEFLQTSISTIQKEISSWERADLIEMRTHDCLPAFNLFGIDETYFIGLYWHKREAVEGPFMKVKNESFKEFVNEHFDSIWEYSSQRKEIVGAIKKKLDPRLKSYVGNWYLYCNKVVKNEESFKLRYMEHGKVVENLFQISAPNGELEVIFASKGKGVFKGKAYLCPTNESFLEMRLTSNSRKNTLHFLFHIGKGLDNYLIGIYNHMYVKAPILGTGLSCMVKMDTVLGEEIVPEKWKGRKIDQIEDEEVRKIIRYITFPSGTRIEAIQSFEQLKSFKRFNLPSLFKGVYKVYSYQGSETKAYNRYISESLLKINDRHQAFHKRYGPSSDKGSFSLSEGKVQASKEDSLIISMKSKDHGRLGFFVINIGDYSPREKHYYTGIFTGVALRNKKVAVGNRVILEYLGEDYELFDTSPIDRYPISSKEIHGVPKEVRENLLGRVNNMVGFLKTQGASSVKALEYEAQNGIDLKQVFFDSACQRALADDVNEIPKAAKMFERAVLHGFRPFLAFEKKLKGYEGNGLVSERVVKGILGNKTYLELKKSVFQ